MPCGGCGGVVVVVMWWLWCCCSCGDVVSVVVWLMWWCGKCGGVVGVGNDEGLPEAVFLMEEWGGRRQTHRRPQTLKVKMVWTTKHSRL